VIWRGIQDQLRRDSIVRHLEDTDPEMLVPTAVRRGARVEHHQVIDLAYKRLVTVAKKDAIHLAGIRLPRDLASGTATVSVNCAEAVLPDGECRRPRQNRRELVVVVVSLHGDQRRDMGQIFEHRAGVDISEMNDQLEARAQEELDHRVGELAPGARMDVRVGNYPDPDWGIEPPLSGDRANLIVPPTHR